MRLENILVFVQCAYCVIFVKIKNILKENRIFFVEVASVGLITKARTSILFLRRIDVMTLLLLLIASAKIQLHLGKKVTSQS